MSEHEDIKDDLKRIETKLDLLIKAFGFRIVQCCKDDYHRVRWASPSNKCPTCDDWSGAPYITKIGLS
jgi:hypothetical protein